LDGGSFSACSSPHTTAPLSDGEHTFEVRATGEAGKADPVPASRSFTVDTEPPDTQIDCGPSDCPYGNWYFGFSSSEELASPPGSSFECRHFAQGETPPAFHSCGSSYYYYLGSNYGFPPDGDYTFEVRATDAAGNTDPTPAVRDFTLNATAPDTQIDSGPPDGAFISNDSPSFGFSSTAADLDHFSCRLTGPNASLDDDPCQSPRNYTDLADGAYTFSVRGTDLVGNLGSARVRHFTVDTAAPQTQIDSGPAGPTNDPTPRFSFSSNEAGASFECRLDGGGYSACSSPRSFGLLPDGPHTFEVRAADDAANTDPSPASRSFTVDTDAPDTQIDSGPSGPTNDATPTFSFSSEAGASFECRLDVGGYSACSSPHTTASLPDGPHTFEVRATDKAANTDPSPASRSFTVGTAASGPPASSLPGTTAPVLAALPPDTFPPNAKLFGKRRQVAGKPIEIVASCAEDCTIVATGSVVVWGGPHKGAARATRRPMAKFGLGKVARQLSAGQVATLKLRLKGKKAKRRLGRLVRSGRKAQAKISVSYRDRAGKASSARLTIRLRRR
jgi:hypothetical protein